MAKQRAMKPGKPDFTQHLPIAIGVLGMALLLIGIMSADGSFHQKALLLTGAAILGISAYMGQQRMLITLQAIVVLGGVLGFFPGLPEIEKYAVMALGGILGLAYLVMCGYFRTDRLGVVGAAGLFLLAIGIATDPVGNPFWFNAFLGFGSIAVAAYSGISFANGVGIAALWLVLNIAFAIKPLLNLAALLNG